MTPRPAVVRGIFSLVLLGMAVAACAPVSYGQGNGYERTFPQSKTAIERMLQGMPTAGRLPVLDGFAVSSSPDHPLDRYRRGYYESKFQVSAAPGGGSVVRVIVEVTAWYADPVTAKSGYQLLTSNGRIEGDVLDQLADQLAANNAQPNPMPAAKTMEKVPMARPTRSATTPFPAESSARGSVSSSASSSGPAATSSLSFPKTGSSPSGNSSSGNAPSESAPSGSSSTASSEPAISAPVPRLPEVTGNYSSSVAHGLADQEKNPQQKEPKKVEEGGPLQTELDGLREALKNQSHPKNLVAVKKSGTPVVSSASLNAKTLFLASAHDEFEMLDYKRDWVHVRISGLSRGWIWRNSLEMPDTVPDGDAPASAAAAPTAAELFRITREEVAPFPGDWAPLRGKRVKIVSVEKTDEGAKDSSPQLRLEFVKSVLDRDYPELAQKTQELAGIVLIFDSADGGMIAATFEILQEWKAGKLSDAALWHQCFFDPPEIFTGSTVAASP
ncbi:MAG: hypothetical protein WBV55_03015 [Candidatus Sulfotelmatobacter sp.]